MWCLIHKERGITSEGKTKHEIMEQNCFEKSTVTGHKLGKPIYKVTDGRDEYVLIERELIIPCGFGWTLKTVTDFDKGYEEGYMKALWDVLKYFHDDYDLGKCIETLERQFKEKKNGRNGIH